ncbi:MAG: Trp family transcriptional regulator [bacterium]|nr:Trp family transcriptional regulator [bacterium]
MPHISKYKLDKAAEHRLIKTLELVLSKITKEEDTSAFLLALLTPTERIMLAKRLGIIILLKEGLPESRIASTLHVTRITVSRMQLFLEARGKGYELAIEILKKEKVMEDLKILLLKLAGYAARAAGGRIKPSIL